MIKISPWSLNAKKITSLKKLSFIFPGRYLQTSLISVLISVFTFLVPGQNLAQTRGTLGNYNVQGANGNLNTLPGLINPAAPNFNLNDLTRNNTNKQTTVNNAYYISNWPTNNTIDLTKYIQFVILPPDAGYSYSISAIRIGLGRVNGNFGNNGPGTVQLRYSGDGYAAPISTVTFTGSNTTALMTVNTNLIAALQNVTTGTFNFRLYFYNGSFGSAIAGIAVNTPSPGSTGIDIDGTIKQVACSGTPVPGLAATTTPTVCPLNPGQLNIAQSLGTGISYQWQASTDGGTTWSNTGTNSYLLTYPGMTVNTDFRCIVTCANGGASATSNTVKITVTNPPPTPGPINGSAALCGGTNGNAFSIATVAGANSYTWSYSGSGATITGQGTSNITINFSPTATSGNLQVISANACGNNGTPSILPITINPPPALPVGFSGTLTPCRGSAGNPYSVNPVAGVSFSWSYSGTGVTINNGNTENPTIDFSAGATNGTLSVTATDANGCISSVLSKAITLAAIPAQPSAITGNTTVCAGTNQTYTVTNIAGITYTWTVPADWTIISGQGNNSISVKPGSTTGTQTLQVVPSNACGDGTARSLNITVNNVPAVPGTISGNNTVCANTTGNLYSIAPVANATSYTWTYSGVGATITGGTAVNPTISFASNATSGDLKVTANNSCGSSIASTYSITINPQPATTGLPSSQSVCSGADIVNILLSNSNGISGTTYSWTRTSPAGIAGTVAASGSGLTDGDFISGIFTNSNSVPITVTFTINSISADGCSGTTATATVVINPTTAITAQPADVTICESANTSFSVTASGGGLAYQWKVSTDGGITWNNITNGPIYSGVNASILNLIKPVIGMNSYQYQCVITGGSCGIVTSDAATITINPLPATTALPLTQTSCSGVAIADIVLSNSNSVAGTTYTWTRTSPSGITGSVPTSGTNVADGTSITGVLTSTNTTATTIDFTVNSMSAAGCAGTTGTAKIIVNPSTKITSQPSSAVICQGATASFSVTATGLSLSYQWQVSTDGGISWTPVSNGGGYTGATTTTLTITNPAVTFSGNQYKCTVTSSCGSVDTNGSATLTINQAPVIAALPISQTICSGTAISNIILSNSNGIVGAKYSWTRNSPAGITGTVATSGTNLSDGAAISGTFTNSNTTPTTVTFTINATGPTPTNCAAAPVTVTVVVNPTTIITTQPASPAAFCAGGNALFTVGATGVNLSYEWQESTNGGSTWNTVNNGGVYTNATTKTLNLTNVPGAMNGYKYRAVVTGDCGAPITNGAATLTVNSAPVPVITSASGDFNICAPGTDKYTVTYTGAPAPTYTWSYTGGTGVTFATTTSNPTTATFAANATSGTLTLRASNTCGNNTVTQLVIVNAITTQPTDQTISASGGAATFTAEATAGSATGYQWQYSANGTTGWINVADGNPTGFSYSNETTGTLSVSPDETTTVSSNYYYRCIITTNIGCTFTSNSARLTVRPVNDLCADAIELVVDDPAMQGTLTNATYTTPPALTPTGADVWYKFTPSCTFNHNITIAGFTGSQVRATLYSGSCAGFTQVATSTNNTTQATFTNINLTNGTTYYVRVYVNIGTPSNFNIQVLQAAPSFTLTNTGTPATGNILTNTTDELFGFRLSPQGCATNFDFTAVRITATGTANGADLTNFRIIYDANNNGIADPSEVSVSGAGIPWAATMNFTVTGQTNINADRRYLLIADVDVNATQGRTFTGNLTAANVSSGVSITGSASGNTQTIRGPQITVSGSHPAPSTVDQNTTNNIVAIFRMVAAYVAATPTGLTLTTSGTYTAGSDVSQFRLYQNSAANMGGVPVLLGTATATAPGTQLNFSFIGTPIALNGTSYLILTADIPNTALDGKTVNIASPPTSAFDFTSITPVVVTGTPGSPASPGKTIRGPRVTISEAHPLAGGMALASTDNPIASYKLDAANANIRPTAFSVTTAGNYTANDITAFSLYQNATNDLNGAPILIGTITAITGQPMTLDFSGFSSNFITIPSGGTSYLIVTADVDYNATINRYVSITSTPFIQFSFNSTGPFNGSLLVAGADPVPAGNRQTIQGSQITISSAHPATGTINQNTVDNVIASYKVVAAFGASTPNGISFTTAGTYLAGTDISQFNLYQNATNNLLGSPTLIGTFTATASGTTIAITGTGVAIAAGVTNYLLITADVPPSGIDGNTIRIATTGISAFDFTDPNGDPVNLVQGSPIPGGNSNYQTIAGPRVRIATVHPPVGNISRGSADNPVAVYQLDVSNSVGTVNPLSITLTTAGGFATGDLANFKLYQNTANTLAGATLVGTINASALASGSVLTFNSGFDNIPNSGTSFLILTADVDPAAVLGRQVRIASVNNSQFDFIGSGGGRVAKQGTNPLVQSNLQTIVGPTATIYTAHPASTNMAVGSGGNLIASYRIAAANSAIIPNSIALTTAGTYRGAGDVINFNLYQNNANSLTGATLVGTIASTGTVSGEILTFTSGNFLSIPPGTDGFLLLTVDISGGATATRTLSIAPANRTNFTFASTAVVDVLGTNPAIAGNAHTIVPFVSVYWSGTNNWNNTSQIWSRVSGGPYNQNVWIVNGIANLEGAGGTISVAQAVSAQRINNNKGGIGLPYTINSNATTYGISLSSPAIVDIASGTTTFGAANNNAVLYGSNGLTKVGNGELAIQSLFASTFGGPVNVNAGELTLGTKTSTTSNPINYLSGNDIVLNNGKLTLAASSGANASLNYLTGVTSSGNSTISLYQTNSNSGVWMPVTPTINAGSFNAANATPLTISGQLTADDGGSVSKTAGTYDNGSQNYIAFGTTTYTGNVVFKGFATSNSILRGAGTHVNINLGGYGHYLSGVVQAAGTINDNGYSTTFFGGGNGSNHAAELCFNSSSSAMTGNWTIGDVAGKDAGWIVTNTSTCLTRGDITVNNYSKLALQLTNSGNSSINYAPTTIKLSGLGPDLRWPSALDFFNFSYGTTILFSNILVNPVPNSRLASIGSMVGATSESSASRASFQLNGTVTGAGGLEKTGVGILVLNAQNGSGFLNSYQDTTRIKMGTLTVNAGSNLGTGPLVMHQNGRYLQSGTGSDGYSTTLNLNNSAQTIASLTSLWTNTSGSYAQVINLTDGHSLTINQSTNTTFGNGNSSNLAGYITGDDANLIKDGSGTLTLTGPNTYTGLTQVKNGTLELNRTNGTTIPDNNNVDIIGGTLKVSKNQVLNNVTLSSGFLRVENGATLTINGTFTLVPSSSNITLVGTGKIVYGPNVTLIYAGNALQVTDASKELPATGGPRNLTFNNYSNAGVRLSANFSLGNTAGIATVNGWLDFNGKSISGPNNIGGLFTLNGLTSADLSGTTTVGSNIISNITTSAIKIGMQVTGPGIPANAAIDYIDPLNPKTVRLNIAATASGTVNLNFGYRGGLMVNMPNGVDGHVQVKGSKIYNPGANYIFNVPTTGNKISPAFPTIGNVLNYSPAWNVTFNAGIKNLVVMNASHDLKIDHDLTMTTGIFVTNSNLITWSNSGGALTGPNMPWTAHNGSYKNSFIAICDEAGTPLTTLDGSKGFRINNLGAKDTYFPIGVSFLPAGPGLDPAPNRMMLNNHGDVNNYTVVINIGDILHTPKPVVERIWYVNPQNEGNSKLTMKLFFTKRDQFNYPVGQNEVESGFDYNALQLVQEEGNVFTRIANGADSLTLTSFPGSENNVDELFGQYTVGISKDAMGNTNGINDFTRYSVVNAGTIILPVKMVDFKAYAQGGGVMTEWKSLVEINVDHYEVERSVDGISFAKLHNIPAKDNGNAVQYSWPDPNPAMGNNFYRIKAVDRDGSVAYTNVINVFFGSQNKPGFTIYPNPATTHQVTLKLDNIPAGRYLIMIYTVDGQLVTNKTIDHLGGNGAVKLNLPVNMVSGTYSVLFNDGKKQFKQLLIVGQ